MTWKPTAYQLSLNKFDSLIIILYKLSSNEGFDNFCLRNDQTHKDTRQQNNSIDGEAKSTLAAEGKISQSVNQMEKSIIL